MSDKITLRFEVPGKDAPGFLKRQRQALEFRQKLQGDVKPESLDEMVEYLAQYVTEPEDAQAKRDVLWMASEAEFMALLNAVTGNTESADENPTE